MPTTVRSITPDELETWVGTFSTAFFFWPTDPVTSAAARRPTFVYDRALAAFDGDRMVATYRSFPTQLTLPGNARIDVNAVSAVSVRPTHRRQGLLRQMIGIDTQRAVERGDVACILIAAEWPIYGRFGYGPATWHAEWTIDMKSTRFGAEPIGSIEIVDLATARAILPALYDRCAASQPGEIARQETRWDYDLGIQEFPGRPRWRGSVVIHRDEAGEPDGFARLHGEERWADGNPDHLLLLDELHAETVEAEMDLWRHVAQMDLVSTIKAEVRRPAEPMKWLLSNPRAAHVTGTTDFVWLRVLDVARFLSARRYERDGDLVLEVLDQLDGRPGPAAGRFRLTVVDGVGTCLPTADAPDVTIEVRALSAAGLGGTRLRDANRRLHSLEHRPGALRETEAMLQTVEPPWCSTWF